MSSDPFAIRQDVVTKDTPVITLAGREWFVPVLVWKQLRVVTGPLQSVLPKIQEAGVRYQSGDPQGVLELMTDGALDTLFEIALSALTRAYPAITEEALEELTILPQELVAAMPVIGQQSGIFKRSNGNDQPGEAEGTDQPSPTSTTSSVTTASAAAKPGRTSSKKA